MRYLFYTLICAVAIFATFSCGNSKQEKLRQQQIEDSIAKVKADSIAKIEAIEKAKADSIARAKADSLEKINNPHPDLKLFNLRGPVNTVHGTGCLGFLKKTLLFSPNGELTSIKIHENGISNTKIHHDGKKISKITYTHEATGDIYNCYIILRTNNSGHINNVICGDDYNDDTNTKYELDPNNLCVKESFLMKPDMIHIVQNYKYIKFDKYGNWTKRNRSGGEYSESMKLLNKYPTTVETRTITYYE